MIDLKKLESNRESLLLAELAAWLHDVGKLCNLHIESHTSGSRRWGNSGSYKVVVNDPRSILSPTQDNNWIRNNLGSRLLRILQNRTPTFYSEFHKLTSKGSQLETILISWNLSLSTLDSLSIAELILLGLPGTAKPADIRACFSKDGWLPAALGISHGIAHHDKQDGDGSQTWPDVFLSTAFGFEQEISDLDNILEQFPLSSSIVQVKKYIIRNFPYGLGDTRRPVNEVTLLDWAWTVAGLYRASVAYAVLKTPQLITDRQNHDLQWRLLSIRTDGLDYLLSSQSIPDLLARKELLKNTWNNVKKLLEETYPLGLEVYRDENGPVFVMPDIEKLLDEAEADGQSLRKLILEKFSEGTINENLELSIQKEIIPNLYLDQKPWKGQPAPEELPPIGRHLERETILTVEPQWIKEKWEPVKTRLNEKPFIFVEEKCIVCGLRPQGWGTLDRQQHYEIKARRQAGDKKAQCYEKCQTCKAISRKVCYVCMKRREDRAMEWATQRLNTTIWTDEVADKNGRIALIVGKFDLEYWLDGTFVRTLSIRDPKNCEANNQKYLQKSWEYVSKNPSFARLRRIWETARKFWKEVKGKIIPEKVEEQSERIFIKGSPSNSLRYYHAYEVEIKKQRISVFWDHSRKSLWIIENPKYFKKRFGIDLKAEIRKLSNLQVFEPSEYGKQRKPVATLTRISVEISQNSAFVPAIPILAEPRTFMAIVPANKAFEVVKAIKTKYEREMGKVRNRLPLHLGIVYAYRKMPLRAIMDAGKRMLDQKSKPTDWKVICLARKLIDKGDELPKRFDPDKNSQFKEWFEILIEAGDRKLTWYVPALMGDGKTEDHWYPYVFLAQDEEPSDRNRYYKAINPWKSAHPWLVHAAELKPGDEIYFTPATFDFEFLETNVKRFEVHYDDNGKRYNSLARPYLLDEITELEEIWRFIAKDKENSKPRLSSSQIFAIRNTIESRREEWFETPEKSITDENFREFCKALFVNAQWQWGKPTSQKINWFTDMAVRGYFTDAIYLFHHIIKEKIEELSQEV